MNASRILRIHTVSDYRAYSPTISDFTDRSRGCCQVAICAVYALCTSNAYSKASTCPSYGAESKLFCHQ